MFALVSGRVLLVILSGYVVLFHCLFLMVCGISFRGAGSAFICFFFIFSELFIYFCPLLFSLSMCMICLSCPERWHGRVLVTLLLLLHYKVTSYYPCVMVCEHRACISLG